MVTSSKIKMKKREKRKKERFESASCLLLALGCCPLSTSLEALV